MVVDRRFFAKYEEASEPLGFVFSARQGPWSVPIFELEDREPYGHFYTSDADEAR
jgi:hypothetical protein